MTRQVFSLGGDREDGLAIAAEFVADAWREFDSARDAEPEISDELRAHLAAGLPQDGIGIFAALGRGGEVLDTSLAQARPRYFAYIGSSGLEVGALADLLAHSYDVNMALNAGGASLMEHQTLRWLGEFVGFPAGSGSFTSGGTISNITALAAARQRALPTSREDGMHGHRAAVYCSAEAHYSVQRAVELLGMGSRGCRSVPIDGARRMRADALDDMLTADKAAGITPVAVVATGGTTLTGAVDPIDAIADVCERHGVWLHIDGAYGLPAASVRAEQFSGLSRADSVSVDAHKWMFVPKACSAVMVRDEEALADAFAHATEYIPAHSRNAVDVTLEYSRPLRSFKLWLAFAVYGAEEFRRALRMNLGQAQLLYDLARAAVNWEVLPNPPQLSIVPIRQVVPGCSDVNAHNAALCEAMQADGRVYLSHADIDGEQWLRPCFTNFRTTDEDVRILLKVADELGHAGCERMHE